MSFFAYVSLIDVSHFLVLPFSWFLLFVSLVEYCLDFYLSFLTPVCIYIYMIIIANIIQYTYLFIYASLRIDLLLVLYILYTSPGKNSRLSSWNHRKSGSTGDMACLNVAMASPARVSTVATQCLCCCRPANKQTKSKPNQSTIQPITKA